VTAGFRFWVLWFQMGRVMWQLRDAFAFFEQAETDDGPLGVLARAILLDEPPPAKVSDSQIHAWIDDIVEDDGA
jgi:hypothetical protein